jgi:hypothetical protein
LAPDAACGDFPERRGRRATAAASFCFVPFVPLTMARAHGTVSHESKDRGRRIMPVRNACLGLALAGALVGSAAEVRAASLLELNFWLPGPRYDQAVPACEYGLSTISYQFAQKEGRFWNSALTIVGYEYVREIAFQPWAAHNIPRRYCTATASVSDGSKRTVRYSIGEGEGMIGASWGVTWCVVGLDRNWAYAPQCRMAMP